METAAHGSGMSEQPGGAEIPAATSRAPPPLGRGASSLDRDQATEPRRILVVEDDFIIGLELETGLTDAGFEVVGVAATAEEALALAVSECPALVVMDIRLASKRDGVDAAIDILRATGVRSIFATANQDPQIKARAASAQPLAWLSKPYEVETLAALITRLLTEEA